MPNVIVINAMATDMILPVHLDTRVLSAEAMLKGMAKVGTQTLAEIMEALQKAYPRDTPYYAVLGQDYLLELVIHS
jgi:hypothetical protein